MADGTKKVHRITKTLYIVFFILGLLSLAFCLGGYTEQQYSLKAERDYQNTICEYKEINIMDALDRLDMCTFQGKEKPEQTFNGLYWPDDDYYCVWARNQTIEQQESTDRHEYCHFLVDNEYEHFCE